MQTDSASNLAPPPQGTAERGAVRPNVDGLNDAAVAPKRAVTHGAVAASGVGRLRPGDLDMKNTPCHDDQHEASPPKSGMTQGYGSQAKSGGQTICLLTNGPPLHDCNRYALLLLLLGDHFVARATSSW